MQQIATLCVINSSYLMVWDLKILKFHDFVGSKLSKLHSLP